MRRRDLLVAIAFIIVVIWAVEFFIYSVGAIIHTLLIAAVVMLFIRYRRWKKRRRKDEVNRPDKPI
jgi:hypothetical protein